MGGRTPAQPQAAREAPQAEPATDYSRRVVWLSAGVAVQSRQLSFSGLESADVYHGRETALMPRAALSIFPFAREGMSGLGVAASFASTVTSNPTEVVARQLDAALAFGLRLGGLPLWLRPEVGFRWHLLFGQGLATEYRAVKAGLSLEAGLGRVRLYGQAAYLVVIGGAGALSREYFPRARTGAAFASEVGLALNVVGKLDLMVSGTYDVYTHALNAEAGDAYVARAATDGYLGATGGLRLSF